MIDFALFFTFLAACGAAAATGAMFQPGEWYRGLNKPGWTPKNWMFPVVWFSLYLCMSCAAMRIAMQAGDNPGAGQALAFWGLQIALNTLWTPVFFGLRRIGAGLVIILFLWLAVAATLVSFWRIDQLAGMLFVPYLLWVTVAALLNRSVYWRNPDAARMG